ncbi:MAG: substrate-binding domain-containing protein [Phycisphaerae bacterium]|nr:substrate-binding domain-containing protein [Phycisphaerae bacterium]
MGKPHKDVADRVFEELLGQLATGHWLPGERLPPVRRLEAMFHTSHLTMLKVLRHAADQRLVSIEPRRAATVREGVVERAARLLAVRQADLHNRRLAVLIPDRYLPLQPNNVLGITVNVLVDEALRRGLAAEVVQWPLLDQVSFVQRFTAQGYAAALAVSFLSGYLTTLHLLKEQKFPVLLVMRQVPSLDLPWVIPDSYGAAQHMAKVLADLGHRNLCMVGRAHDTLFSRFDFQHDGWMDYLKESGLIRTCSFPFYYVRLYDNDLFIDPIFDHPNGPTAVVFEGGTLCADFLGKKRFAHLRIPQDVSICSFNWMPAGPREVAAPPITAATFDPAEMARAIIASVEAMIAGHRDPGNATVPMTLHVTDSIAPPMGDQVHIL